MKYISLLVLILLLPSPASTFIQDAGIGLIQEEVSAMTPGKRISLWAEKFVGTPYDPDPLGEYVTKAVIVADERVDCMYLVFRAVELAMSRTPEEAVEVALDKRFITRGVLKDGKVLNYDERFQYAADMLDSGKWGTEITGKLAETEEITGSRGRETVRMIPRDRIPDTIDSLNPGDIIFFIKDPEKRVVGEIVGHIGIMGDNVFLIHASGRKNRGGEVKKELLAEYIKSMPFIGIRVSRF
jgi:hypothetical protein